MMVKVSIREAGVEVFTEVGTLELEQAIRFFGLCESQAVDVRIQLHANGVDTVYHLPGDRKIGMIRDREAEGPGRTDDSALWIDGMQVVLGPETKPIEIWDEDFGVRCGSLPSWWGEVAVRAWILGHRQGVQSGKGLGRAEIQHQMRKLLQAAPAS